MQRSGNHKKMLVWYLWSLKHNDTVLVLLASQNGIAWGSAFSSSVWGNRNFKAGSGRLLSDYCNIYIQTVYFIKKFVVKHQSCLQCQAKVSLSQELWDIIPLHPWESSENLFKLANIFSVPLEIYKTDICNGTSLIQCRHKPIYWKLCSAPP